MVEETPWQQALRFENRANPYPFYAELRKTPVARQPDGTYVVSTYREVVQLLHDPRVSSDLSKRARAGSSVGGKAQQAGSPNALAALRTILREDPPEHDRHRRLMMRHFGPPNSPHLVTDMEPEIRRIVDGLLDQMAGKARIDFVDEFAYPLPVTVICEVLGVPVEAAPHFHAWIEQALNGLDYRPEGAPGAKQPPPAAALHAVEEIMHFMDGLIDQYTKKPGPGVLSAMVNDDDLMQSMSKGDLVGNALILLFAGHETTVNLIAHGVLTLLRHPEALEQLRRRPELIVPGVEELLRLESSVQFWPGRFAVEDIEIAGTTIPKDATIFLAYGSANRDPERFANPDEVQLDRHDNEHLGFSQGIHVCFGGPLARLEAQVAIGGFVRRVQNPRLVVDPPPYRHNQLFRGPSHVLVDIDGIQADTRSSARTRVLV